MQAVDSRVLLLVNQVWGIKQLMMALERVFHVVHMLCGYSGLKTLCEGYASQRHTVIAGKSEVQLTHVLVACRAVRVPRLHSLIPMVPSTLPPG